MSDGRLFSLDEIPEVPLFRPPAPRKGARHGWQDERLSHDYPPEWDRCTTCGGDGKVGARRVPDGFTKDIFVMDQCPDCLGMGSLKARVRLEAGHRCVRCKHPYVPQTDAKMLGVEPSGMHDCEACGGTRWAKLPEWSLGVESGVEVVSAETRPIIPGVVCPVCKGAGKVWTPWSLCDDQCVHAGPIRWATFENGTSWAYTQGSEENRRLSGGRWPPGSLVRTTLVAVRPFKLGVVEAEYRILTVHHLDGDKANCRWWNLAALCQRCHLEIQAKVVMERVWPHEHSEWFRPYVAAYYAFVYNGEELSRDEVNARMDELLALEHGT